MSLFQLPIVPDTATELALPPHHDLVYGNGAVDDTRDWRRHLSIGSCALDAALEAWDALATSVPLLRLTREEFAEGVRRTLLLHHGERVVRQEGRERFFSREQVRAMADALLADAGIELPRGPWPSPRVAEGNVTLHPAPLPAGVGTALALVHATARAAAVTLLGWHSRFVATPWGRMHVLDSHAAPPPYGGATGAVAAAADAEAAGRPLVLVHGLCATGLSMLPLATLLRARRRVLVPDLLDFDFGFSRSERGLTRAAAQAEALAALVERVEGEGAGGEAGEAAAGVDLCGHSFGGWLCLRAAALRPAMVKHLVLLSPGGCGRYRVMNSAASIAAPAAHVERLFAVAHPSMPRLAARALALASCTLFRAPHTLRVMLPVTYEEYFGARLTVPVPACVVWGDCDVVHLPHAADVVLRGLPNGVGYWLAGGDHFLNATALAEVAWAADHFLPPATQPPLQRAAGAPGDPGPLRMAGLGRRARGSTRALRWATGTQWARRARMPQRLTPMARGGASLSHERWLALALHGDPQCPLPALREALVGNTAGGAAGSGQAGEEEGAVEGGEVTDPADPLHDVTHAVVPLPSRL